jgi:alpha-L-fucosidase 2
MNGLKLYEDTPAELFDDTHLLGNGSLGASVFGSVPYEKILINHDTLWSGQESRKINEGTREHLEEARGLALNGKLKEANNLINDEMLGFWSEAYLPLGALHITIGHRNDQRSMPQRRRLLNETPYEGYSRSLDIERAVACVQYDQAGVHYTREMFVSCPDNVLAVKLTAQGGELVFSMCMDSPLRHEQRVGADSAAIIGRAPDRVEPYEPHFNPTTAYLEDERSDALRFASAARVVRTDGILRADEFRVYVSNATYAVILLSAGTNYAGYKTKRNRDSGHVLSGCLDVIDRAAFKGYDSLLADHVADYRSLYQRFHLDLGEAITDALPTSERLRKLKSVDDPSVLTLVAQYSRYLLISFSRPGTQAGNLQGIWNPSERPPWASNYTTNINVQMNYWGAEAFGLSECHLPMSDLVRELSDSGREAARDLYGADGWVTHHNTDLWRFAGIAGEDASWAWWPVGGFWMCQHLWQHYEYTLDEAYLRDTVYPVLRGAAQFLLDFLVRDHRGRYVTALSTSPENKFFLPGSSIKEVLDKVDAGNRFSANRRDISAICRMSTMDLALTRELLGNYRAAAEKVGCADSLTDCAQVVLENLHPFQVGRFGQLQEWEEDYEECTPGMGHVSHLYSVYPAAVINATSTPDLFAAAHKSLLRRMQHGSGRNHWPGAWNICLNARFLDGVQCSLGNRTMPDGLGANLLTKNTWQIDAVMGWGAAIAEMLLQSHEGFLRLLPALAPSWMRGSVKGLRARGGFSVDMEWDGSVLTRAEIRSSHGGRIVVCYGSNSAQYDIPAGKSIAIGGSLKQL